MFAKAQRKEQTSCAVNAQLISSFVFATMIVQFPLYFFPIFKILAFFYGCISRFVPDLVECPEDLFSHIVAHICLIFFCWFVLDLNYFHADNKEVI